MDFLTWLKLYDLETECSIPEQYIDALKDAFDAGQKNCEKKKKDNKKDNQNFLFSEICDKIDAEYIDSIYKGMPEYDNTQQKNPVITATFKFASVEDYEDFKEKIKTFLFNGEKVFDGEQKLNEKQSWYPHKPKASRYIYIDGGEK